MAFAATARISLRSPLVVIGANAVGLELGQACLRLGSEVTFLDIAPRIAPFEEPDIPHALTEAGSPRRKRQRGATGR